VVSYFLPYFTRYLRLLRDEATRSFVADLHHVLEWEVVREMLDEDERSKSQGFSGGVIVVDAIHRFLESICTRLARLQKKGVNAYDVGVVMRRLTEATQQLAALVAAAAAPATVPNDIKASKAGRKRRIKRLKS